MESIQNLKRRVKGVHNINQITKAMELVAATKMRKSQEIALASRPFVYAALDLLSNIVRLEGVPLPALLTPREVNRTCYLVVTSDKGLAGSFNNAVLRAFESYAARERVDFTDPSNSFIAVGQKAAALIEKKVDARMQKFVRFGDYTTIEEITPLADELVRGYLALEWDRVIAFSTHFRSALVQDVLIRTILPASFEALKKSAEQIVPETGKFREMVRQHDIPLFARPSEAPEYLIEPSAREVLDALASHLVLTEIYHLILEANASEHAARRAAMKNASENAEELVEALGIQYNKSRQAGITREIIEIIAGAESLI